MIFLNYQKSKSFMVLSNCLMLPLTLAHIYIYRKGKHWDDEIGVGGKGSGQ